VVDWQALLANTLWVLGLSSVLAGLCIKSYVGLLKAAAPACDAERIHEPLAHTAPLFLQIGLILFCSGLLSLSTTTWERAAWALALALSIKGLARWLRPAASSPSPSRK
jgi:hypothetical protein